MYFLNRFVMMEIQLMVTDVQAVVRLRRIGHLQGQEQPDRDAKSQQ